MFDKVFGLSELDGTAKAFLDHALRQRTGSLPIVLALIGGMGAGKTTLFRAMGTCLDCDPLPTSPTYALIQEYRTADGKVVIHADLDRLRGPEVVGLGPGALIGPGRLGLAGMAGTSRPLFACIDSFL